jgi:hypothetical protein
MSFKLLLGGLVIATTCSFIAGCSDDGSSGTGRAGQAKPNLSAAAPITFTAIDHTSGATTPVTIKGPTKVPAGLVKFTLRNKSGSNPHDAQIVRVTGHHSVREIISRTIDNKPGRPIPDWVSARGGVGTVDPGRSATAFQVLRPGVYYVLDSETADVSHTLHAYNGGVAKFRVVGQSQQHLPRTIAKITADDYAFAARGVRPGKNWLTFENAGQQLHHLIAFPYRGDTTFKDAVEDIYGIRDATANPIPLNRDPLVSRGTAVIDAGEKQIVEMDFKKGKYAMVCFITDRDGGRPHFELGMIDELIVE